MRYPKKPMLSKSRFIAGLQCPLRLWYQSYNSELATKPPPSQQALFDTGHEVGRLATSLYSNGVQIEESYLHHMEAEKSTLKAMNNQSVAAIYEAAFTYNRIRIRVDILERHDVNTWNLVEVKSSTSVKDVYKPDLGIQYYILKGLGIDIFSAGILHINNAYVYDGNQLDLNQFFYFSDLTEETVSRQEEFISQIKELKKIISWGTPPNIHPSRHCMNPYKCEFWEHCTSDMPEFWVMDLSGINQKKFDQLTESGIEDISGIPDEFPLSALQERIRNCVISGQEFIAPELEDELMGVEYPVHFLDFETFASAIPRYVNTRPYQTIPFQWSNHILFEDGRVEHVEYLCVEDKDPCEEFTKALLETLGIRGTIFVYASYEKRIVNQLANQLPGLRNQLLERCATKCRHPYDRNNGWCDHDPDGEFTNGSTVTDSCDEHPDKWRPGNPPRPVKCRPVMQKSSICTVDPIAEARQVGEVINGCCGIRSQMNQGWAGNENEQQQRGSENHVDFTESLHASIQTPDD